MLLFMILVTENDTWTKRRHSFSQRIERKVAER